MRCEPRAETMYGEAFLDEGCTELVYSISEGCALPPFVVTVHFGPMCGAEDTPRFTYFRIGERLSETRVFRRTRDGSCSAESSSEALHRLVPLDLDVLVEAEVEEGSGARLVQDQLVAADGSRQRFGLRDTLRGEACRVLGLGGYVIGPERAPCLPESAAAVVLGGASCDERWASRPVGSECLPSPELAYAETRSGSCGAAGVELFTTGAPIPASERVFGEACDGTEHAELFGLEPAADDAVPWLTRTRTGEGRVQRVAWTLGDVSVGGYFYDTELELPCWPLFTVDGELRCLPSLVSISVGAWPRFLDEECTRPGAPLDDCDRRWLIEPALPTGTCAREVGGVAAVHRIGDPVGRGYRLDATGACVPSDDDVIVHALERLPVTDFPLLESSAP